ncbi:MAG: hypothetical protein LM561_03005 [Desulfurococcaceae archaeon]|nr:hypothetical protein [Desulfurococcaceae archaeon]
MLRKRRKIKTLILGDSFSGNVYAAQDLSNSLFLSWPGSTSALDGWGFADTCIDRTPIFLEEPDCLRRLGLESSEIDYEYVLIGEEASLKDKFSLRGEETPDYTWYDLFPRTYSKVYKPVLSWCQIIKLLRNSVEVPRLYANVTSIDPKEKTVLLEGGALIEYEEIVSSIPQDLLLSRLRGVGLEGIHENYAYLPYNISLIIGKIDQRIGENEVVVYALGRKRYVASHAILLKSVIDAVTKEHALIYVLTPLRRGADKTEILVKNFSELKNLGIKVREVVFARSYLEKYGRILKLGRSPYDELLGELNIRFIGRYGSWEELSICNIIKKILSTHKRL